MPFVRGSFRSTLDPVLWDAVKRRFARALASDGRGIPRPGDGGCLSHQGDHIESDAGPRPGHSRALLLGGTAARQPCHGEEPCTDPECEAELPGAGASGSRPCRPAPFSAWAGGRLLSESSRFRNLPGWGASGDLPFGQAKPVPGQSELPSAIAMSCSGRPRPGQRGPGSRTALQIHRPDRCRTPCERGRTAAPVAFRAGGASRNAVRSEALAGADRRGVIRIGS